MLSSSERSRGGCGRFLAWLGSDRALDILEALVVVVLATLVLPLLHGGQFVSVLHVLILYSI